MLAIDQGSGRLLTCCAPKTGRRSRSPCCRAHGVAPLQTRRPTRLRARGQGDLGTTSSSNAWPGRSTSVGSCVPSVKGVGKADEGEPDVRSDGGELETGQSGRPSAGPRPCAGKGHHDGPVGIQVAGHLELRELRTRLRTGNAADRFASLDRYVEWRLKRLLIKKRARNLRAGQAERWTQTWFHDRGLHKLMGTIRYPKAA